MRTAQAEQARNPAASSSAHRTPGVRCHLSSQGSSPASFSFSARRSTVVLSWLLCERKTSKRCTLMFNPTDTALHTRYCVYRARQETPPEMLCRSGAHAGFHIPDDCRQIRLTHCECTVAVLPYILM